jgi:hypothetical protein
MRRLLTIFLFALVLISVAVGPYLYKRYQQHKAFNIPPATPPSTLELGKTIRKKLPKKTAKVGVEPILGINTADVREDTSSVQFLNLFKTAIPFNETIPWGSSKDVEYDKNGWPSNLNGGKAGTKFLNRLPEGTIEDGFFTVLYDGEGEIFYGNDARLIVHRPGKDIIEIKAGKDHILNASLFIKKTTPDNYIRNIRILPEGGICEGTPHIRVKSASECGKKKYLAFDEHDDTILFNPDYLAFMKDFQVIRFMNMSGMTRNPVEKWENRNTPGKATWGGKYGSRGAPVEIMVALANQVKADPWFSMPYKANDDYIRKFAEYVKAHLDPKLKAYIEYSNEVWNPIFIHHDYAIEKGMEAGLDDNKSLAGYKWYSRRSVQTFKIWEDVFNDETRLVRTLGSWASNQNMSSQILAFEDAFKHTDAIAIGPYVSAHPKELRKAKNVDEVFELMMDKTSKWGMQSIIRYINNQAKVANSYGVDLVAYEGGQHLVDWNTRKKDEDPNPLLYAANRDPRMGIIYDELLREWRRAGGKLFVAFSAPRIYSWYGSWGVKEHIRQPRSEAPKYDALLRYLDETLHPENINQGAQKTLAAKQDKTIGIRYAKLPYQIWDMSRNHLLKPSSKNTSISDISLNWQANWDSGHLYFSFSVRDDDLEKGDELLLTLDASEGTKTNDNKKYITVSSAEKKPDNDSDSSNNTNEEETTVAKTFVFTPFDNNNSQTHLTRTKLGYVLNLAIPWSEIYEGERTPKTGYKIGINIKLTDVDKDERGSQILYLNTQNKALPELELNY